MKNLKKLLEEFNYISNNDADSWILDIFKIEDYAYATDGKLLLRKRCNSDFNQIPESHYNYKTKIENYFNEDFKVSKFYDCLSLSEHISMLKNKPLYKTKSIKCPECDGYGLVDWEYTGYPDREHDCPKCDGEQKINIKGNELECYIYSELTRVEIFEKQLFDPKYINFLTSLSKEIKFNKLIDNRNIIGGSVGDYEFILHGFTNKNDDEVIINIEHLKINK